MSAWPPTDGWWGLSRMGPSFDKELSLKWEGRHRVHGPEHGVGAGGSQLPEPVTRRHPKWVIPWMEDDRRLTEPQLWVNRTLQPTWTDALEYGATGLLGIHWRTRVTSPTISARAQKSWEFGLTSERILG